MNSALGYASASSSLYAPPPHHPPEGTTTTFAFIVISLAIVTAGCVVATICLTCRHPVHNFSHQSRDQETTDTDNEDDLEADQVYGRQQQREEVLAVELVAYKKDGADKKEPPPGSGECVICMEDFEDREEQGVLPVCNHAFHPECIHRWLRIHSSCPLCRHY